MISVLTILLLLIIYICFALYVGFHKLTDYNQSPLMIRTFDGSDSPYHPSVLYKKGYFSGYNYIMSETPFYISLPNSGKRYRDQFECPSIHFSFDGIHWEEKILNPISDLTEKQKANKDYFSDPDLVITPDGIECWYRINRRYGSIHGHDKISLLRKKSTDGILWSQEEEIINLETNGEASVLGKIIVSPAVIFEQDKYKLWYVDNVHKGKGHIRYAYCEPSLSEWKDGNTINMEGPSISPWHIHILKDENTYWLTVYDRNNITLWRGDSEKTFSYVKTLITPSKIIGSFYSHGVYRACMIKTPESNYRLYFSGNDLFKTYIGIMEGETPEDMTIMNNDKPFRAYYSFSYIWTKTKLGEIHKRINYLIKRIWNIFAHHCKKRI